jgi:hypothetical protein
MELIILLLYNIIFVPNNHRWAMPNYFMTSGTRLTPDARMPMPD